MTPPPAGFTTLLLDRLVAQGVHELRRVCAVDVTFGGLLDASGTPAVPIRHIDGNIGATLLTVRVATGRGLGGRVLDSGRPMWLENYFDTDAIVRSYDKAVAPERLRATAAVPVVIAGKTRGLLYIANRGEESFGERVLGRAVSVSRRIERDLLVEQEVRRRLADAVGQSHPGMNRRTRDDLRELAADLGSMIELVRDENARARLADIATRLSTLLPPEPGRRTGCPPKVALTARELEVIEHVAAGQTNKEISADLGLMTTTVKAYLKGAARKLGAGNRTQAVYLARQAGLIR